MSLLRYIQLMFNIFHEISAGDVLSSSVGLQLSS